MLTEDIKDFLKNLSDKYDYCQQLAWDAEEDIHNQGKLEAIWEGYISIHCASVHQANEEVDKYTISLKGEGKK